MFLVVVVVSHAAAAVLDISRFPTQRTATKSHNIR